MPAPDDYGRDEGPGERLRWRPHSPSRRTCRSRSRSCSRAPYNARKARLRERSLSSPTRPTACGSFGDVALVLAQLGAQQARAGPARFSHRASRPAYGDLREPRANALRHPFLPSRQASARGEAVSRKGIPLGASDSARWRSLRPMPAGCGRRAAAHACRGSGQPVLSGPGHLPKGEFVAAAGEKRAPSPLSASGTHVLAGVVGELACPAGQLGELR